jgi:hypothetical protein
MGCKMKEDSHLYHSINTIWIICEFLVLQTIRKEPAANIYPPWNQDEYRFQDEYSNACGMNYTLEL